MNLDWLQKLSPFSKTQQSSSSGLPGEEDKPSKDLNHQRSSERLESLESKLYDSNTNTDNTLHYQNEPSFLKSDQVGGRKSQSPERVSDTSNVKQSAPVNSSRAGSSNPPSEWLDDDIQVKESRKPLKKRRRLSLLNKLILGAAVLLIIALAAAIFIWTREVNTIDPEKVVTRATAPVETEASQLSNLEVSIQNNNTTTLVDAVLITRYGEGSYSATGTSIDRIDIGSLEESQIKTIDVPFSLTGSVGDVRVLDFELEYSIPESQSRYALEFSKELEIESSPVSLRLDLESEQTIGDTSPFAISLSTNKVLGSGPYQLFVRADNTLGLSAPELQIDPESSENVISITLDQLEPRESFDLIGQVEARSPNPGQAQVIVELRKDDTVLAIAEEVLDLVLPPLMVTRNGRSAGVINEQLEMRFRFQNTTDSILRDVAIIGELDGAYTNIRTPRGVYNSAQETLSYNPITNSQLSEIEPGESVDVSATLTPISGSELSVGWKANGLQLSVSENRRQLTEQEFVYGLESALLVEAFALYRQGGVVNKGPLPPVVDRTTTYLVRFDTRVANFEYAPQEFRATVSENVEVVDLPRGIRQTGNQLVWDRPSRADSIEFVVALTPDASQVNQVVNLLEDIEFLYEESREDRIESLPPITTNLEKDSGFNENEAIVQPAN